MAQLGPACVSQDNSFSNSSTKILQDSIEHQVKTIDPLIIRDQCDCERCVDPSSHQKLFQSSDIPSSIRPREITLKSNEARLTWENDIRSYPADHTTVISWNRIEDIFNGELPKRPTTWARSAFTKDHVRFQWPSARKGSESLYGLLTELSRHGIVFLEGMPGLDEDDPGRSSNYGVEQIGAEIGPLRDSFYGRTWDVKSVANAKNIAYTHQHLGLHMDLLYMTNPPNFQILHCLQASTTGGGESVFVDAFRAAEMILQKSPNRAEHPLCTYPVPYHYHHVDAKADLRNNHYYAHSHPVIELDERQNIVNVNWSPPFQAPLRPDPPKNGFGVPPCPLRDWHQAAQEFAQIIDRPDMQFEYLLKPGEAVIFNNRRVLHARMAFDVAKGPRWLKGAYIDGDSVWSKLGVLRELASRDQI